MISIKKKHEKERVCAEKWVCFIGHTLDLNFLWSYEKLHKPTVP